MNKYKKIGKDVRVNDLSIISYPELVSLGNHISIDQWAYVSTALELGDYIHIAPSVSIIGGKKALLKMGHFTNIGSGGRIVCSSDDFSKGLISPVVPIEHRVTVCSPVVFEDFATLGVNCSVLPGVKLAQGTIVGANSLVTKDTKPWTIYGGSPARPIGLRDRDQALNSARQLGYEINEELP